MRSPHQVAQLDEIPGVGKTGAQELIAEIRTDMTRIAAAQIKTFLGSRYHRLARRRGKPRALVAVGNSILIIAWHLLADPNAHFTDLGRTGTTGSPRCAANASSSPSWNGYPARRSCSPKSPPDQPPTSVRLRCAPPDAAARPAEHLLSIQPA